MKKIISALVAVTLLMGTAYAQTRPQMQNPKTVQAKAQPAKAQHTGAQHTGAQHTGAQHTGAQHTGAQHTGAQHTKAQTNRYPAPPKHWKGGSAKQWQAHVDRCARKYRSYKAKTDRYTVRAGKTAICRL